MGRSSRVQQVTALGALILAAGLHSGPAAAQSAAGAQAIQAANAAVNDVVTGVSEEVTAGAGVLTGLPVNSEAADQEMVEQTESEDEAIEAESEGIITAIYNQFGYPSAGTSAVGDELDTAFSNIPTATQALTQLPGVVDSATGDEISSAEKAATEADEADLINGPGPLLNKRSTATREGIQGNAVAALAAEEEADDVYTTAASTANVQHDLASSMQTLVRTDIALMKEVNTETEAINNETLGETLLPEEKQENEAEREADVQATEALFD